MKPLSITGGQTGPTSTHIQGKPPQPWPMSRQTGAPNQAPTVAFSRSSQQTMNADDIEQWAGDEDSEGTSFDLPLYAPSQSFGMKYTGANQHENSDLDNDDIIYEYMNKVALKRFIKETIQDLINEDELDEASAVGGGAMGAPGQPSGQIRGHMGAKKRLKKDKNFFHRTFGG